MLPRFLIVIWLGVLLAASGNALHAAQVDPNTILHELRRAEENIVNGVPGSLEQRAQLLTSLGNSLRRIDPSRHAEDEVRIGALVFVLSGGDPRFLRNILASLQAEDTLASLLRGVVHITDNNIAKAQPEIDPIDPRSLPRSIAPQVALVKASLLAHSDLNMALQVLDDAVLLGRGTIFEQEALRQQSVILQHNGEFEKFLRLYHRYRLRFARSNYSPEYLDRLNGLLASFDYSAERGRIAKVIELIGQMPAEERVHIRLRLSELGLRNGNLVFVRELAEAQLPGEEPPSARRNQLAVYGLSAEVVLGDAEESKQKLLNLEVQDLPEDVTALRLGAIWLAERFLDADGTSVEQPEPETDIGGAVEDPDLASQLTKAKSALETASQQIGEMAR